MPDDVTTGLVEVWRSPTLAEAEQHALVLAAVGIPCQLSPVRGGVGLFVAPAAAEHARRQLASYERENVGERHPPLPARSAFYGLEAALAHCAVLVFVFAAQQRGAFGIDWGPIGAAQAGLIRDGAWWRTLTALGLHIDIGHLMSNLAGGVAFGLLLSQLVGWGLAWLGIVLTGALGNAASAVLHSPEHAAVGASTAVFGALGLLSGYTQRSRYHPWRRGLRRWAPVAAGIMLVAFLGLGGERTDVWAHVGGFAAGGLLGFAFAPAVQRVMDRPRVQYLGGAVACGLFALAWVVAAWG